MTRTPFFIREARLNFIRSQDPDSLGVLRFRLIGKKIRFLAEDLWSWLSAPRVVAILMLVVGLLGMALDFASTQDDAAAWTLSVADSIFVGLSPEFVSIAIGILIIDWANARVSKQDRKNELISQLQSESSSMSLEALAELRASGWLYDGTLERETITQANLKEANLVASFFFEPELGSIERKPLFPQLKGASLKFARFQGANLVGANLSKSDLFASDLSGAQLSGADLEAANLRAADFAGTDLRDINLKGSNLTDANLKDALIGDERPKCDRKTVLPDGSYWSSNEDLLRFVDQSRADFWGAPDQSFAEIEDHIND